jgi:hypothetical protein
VILYQQAPSDNVTFGANATEVIPYQQALSPEKKPVKKILPLTYEKLPD